MKQRGKKDERIDVNLKYIQDNKEDMLNLLATINRLMMKEVNEHSLSNEETQKIDSNLAVLQDIVYRS